MTEYRLFFPDNKLLFTNHCFSIHKFESNCAANLMARDIRSTLGNNLRLINEFSNRNPWTDSSACIKVGLVTAETVDTPEADKWRIKYLDLLLEQRQQWHYLGAEDEEAKLQKLVDSLCIN